MYQDFITSFINALANKKSLDFQIIFNDSEHLSDKNRIINLDYPESILSFYERICYLNITSPRNFVLLNPSDFKFIEKDYLLFSTVNNTNICFDVKFLNPANEWNIINPDNGFIITKTFASYITNKLWAWIDRGRLFWEKEHFSD